MKLTELHWRIAVQFSSAQFSRFVYALCRYTNRLQTRDQQNTVS